MTTRDALEDRKNALERELTRRQAKKSNSERQAALVTRAENVAEDRDDEREPAWGDDGERSGRGSSASRRQASLVTRRGDS